MVPPPWLDGAEIILDAIAKLGEILAGIKPKYKPLGSYGGTKGPPLRVKTLPYGITKKESHYVQEIFRHPNIGEKLKKNMPPPSSEGRNLGLDMQIKEQIPVFFLRRAKDNPTVFVKGGDVEAAIRLLRKKTQLYGGLKALRFRQNFPGRGVRKRAKAKEAAKRLRKNNRKGLKKND